MKPPIFLINRQHKVTPTKTETKKYFESNQVDDINMYWHITNAINGFFFVMFSIRVIHFLSRQSSTTIDKKRTEYLFSKEKDNIFFILILYIYIRTSLNPSTITK